MKKLQVCFVFCDILIIDQDHPVTVEMFAQPIVGKLYCFIDFFNHVISALNSLSHIAPRIQLSLRIGWLEVQPIEGTRLEDHCGKQSFSSVEWFDVASLRVSCIPQLCPTEL